MSNFLFELVLLSSFTRHNTLDFGKSQLQKSPGIGLPLGITLDLYRPRAQSHQRFGGYFNENTRLDVQLDESKQAELKNDVLEEIRLAKGALNEYQEDIAKQSVDYLRVRNF